MTYTRKPPVQEKPPLVAELSVAWQRLRAAVQVDLEQSTVDSHVARAEAAADYNLALERWQRSLSEKVDEAMEQHELEARMRAAAPLLRRRRVATALTVATVLCFLAGWGWVIAKRWP